MQAQVISFYCVLKNKFGQVLSTSNNNDVLTAGHDDDVFLKELQVGLQNIKEGEKRKIHIDAQNAYGFYQIEKLKKVDHSVFKKVKVGDVIYLNEDATAYRVTQIENGKLLLDGNHPLAGQDLVFEIEATKVRDAEPEEIEAQVVNQFTEIFH